MLKNSKCCNLKNQTFMIFQGVCLKNITKTTKTSMHIIYIISIHILLLLLRTRLYAGFKPFNVFKISIYWGGCKTYNSLQKTTIWLPKDYKKVIKTTILVKF